MKTKIEEDLCIGCDLCPNTCPELFEMESDKAKVKVNPIPPSLEDCLKEVRDACPVGAITIEE
jgi:ferredoxin